MNYIKVFELVESEFNKETAILTTMATGIAMQVKPKDKDFHENSYTKRRNKKIREVLWEHPKEKVTLAIDLIMALYYYDLDQTLGGKHKTLKECLKIARESNQKMV